MPYFICPNCKQRSIDHDRLQEIDNVPVTCDRCGFGFLFELMDDYYPAPTTGLVTCDQEGRILAFARSILRSAQAARNPVISRAVRRAFGVRSVGSLHELRMTDWFANLMAGGAMESDDNKGSERDLPGRCLAMPPAKHEKLPAG